jgi:DNA-binding beta-propeller fold protein YncE
MRVSQFWRSTIWIWTGAAMLTACVQMQPPLGTARAASRGSHASGKILDYLYVSDQGAREVEVLANGSYQKVGAITRGIEGPAGLFLDDGGNLYVANYLGGDITEYAHGSARPKFRFGARMVEPLDVSVDRDGNVYEADFDGKFVNEYRQASNKVVNSCAEAGSPWSVAVDAAGDVFVAVDSNRGGKIVEFAGGLSGCNGKTLGVTFSYAGGTVLDKQGDLIVCDSSRPGAVDLIEPPYEKVARKLGSHWSSPSRLAIDKTNALIFVTDKDAAMVTVIDYRTGKIVSSVGGGLSKPAGVVDEPNAVY